MFLGKTLFLSCKAGTHSLQRKVEPTLVPNAEIVLGQLFQLKAVTIHTVSEVYIQLCRYLQSIYNSE